MTDEESLLLRPPAQFRLIGMDCAKDATEIEAAVRRVPGIARARVSVASHILSVWSESSADAELRGAVVALGYGLERLSGEGPPSQSSGLQDAGYRKALRIVVALNLGYGVVEIVGGFLSESQALKADALDFLGDGLITLLALFAIGWSLAWRARAALIQGIFLGILGAGVIADTLRRFLGSEPPEPYLMGGLGMAAVVVNVAAAVVLLPHRTGDANARAVWLFSRNDALGNVAVVAAAALVVLTGRAWPDLAVAAAVSALFLHSAWAIVRDARRDLSTAD